MSSVYFFGNLTNPIILYFVIGSSSATISVGLESPGNSFIAPDMNVLGAEVAEFTSDLWRMGDVAVVSFCNV